MFMQCTLLIKCVNKNSYILDTRLFEHVVEFDEWHFERKLQYQKEKQI